MPMPEIKRAEADKTLSSFCETRVPPRIQSKLRYIYKFRGNDVTLFEERPLWAGRGGKWTQVSVAKFRCDPDSMKWSLYWQRGNGRWLKCDWFLPKVRFSAALKEVERDALCVFFG